MTKPFWGQLAAVLVTFVAVSALSIADGRTDQESVLGIGRLAIAAVLAVITIQRVQRIVQRDREARPRQALVVLAGIETVYVVLAAVALLAGWAVVDGPVPVLLGLFLLAVHGTLATTLE
ncbi:hypothetical protein [Ornithinimicrobium sediminis]|uniref:hypothetical protein n=1 Tax=Ornithinimicrobium sediminis TaxID=2904603 RepID=UPI001E2C0D14|nr:hypothetical protein [Ornithinimicrobium sediminis]MCE0485245.1 hypothetical protein [Ornithinimicrobium sediminis]